MSPKDIDKSRFVLTGTAMSSLEQLEEQIIGDEPVLPCEAYSP